jgi:hypothetical protein
MRKHAKPVLADPVRATLDESREDCRIPRFGLGWKGWWLHHESGKMPLARSSTLAFD